MPYKPVKSETYSQAEAFELYYSLGDDRSFEAVAKAFNVTRTTISNWAAAFHWRARIIERDHQLKEKLRKQVMKDIYEDRLNYRKILKESMTEYVKNLKNGKVRPKDINDFVRLVDLDSRIVNSIMGDSAEDVHVSGDTLSTLDSLKEAFNNVEEPEDLDDDNLEDKT